MNEFYMAADYVQDGADRYLVCIIAALNEAKAVSGLLHQLESEGADVKQITVVYGVSSIEELDEIVKGGLKPGMVYSIHTMGPEQKKKPVRAANTGRPWVKR